MKKILAIVLVLMLAVVSSGFALTSADFKGTEGEFYWIGKTYNSDSWLAMIYGVQLLRDETETSWTIICPDKGESDINGQIQLVENAIDAGAACIVMAPNDSDSLIDVSQKVLDSNIPLVVFDTALNAPVWTVLYNFDFYTQGWNAGEALAADVNGEEAKVALISGNSGAGSHIARNEGFRDAIAQYDNISIVSDNNYAEGDTIVAQNLAIDILTANPDLYGFFCCNNVSIIGTAGGIQTANSEAVVYGNDCEDTILGYMDDGIVVYTSSAFCQAMGYVSALLGVMTAAGAEYVDFEWEGFSFVYDSEEKSYKLPFTALTPDTVDTPECFYVANQLQWFEDRYPGVYPHD